MAIIGKTFEERLWNFFMPLVGNAYGVSALAGNWRAECENKANNLQNSFQKKLGHTDESYTAAVDDGTYTNFVYDGAGYGTAQWTHWARKQGLLYYAKQKGVSIGNEEMMFEYAWKELSTEYKTVLAVMKAAKSVKEASDVILTKYERPKDQGETAKATRTAYGEEFYKKYAGANNVSQTGGKIMGIVIIGSARSNENGGINGGAAGDQTGGEVSTQPYYLHSKGQIVIRAKDPAVLEKIAHNMESMCANDNIGYCQDHRSTLTAAAKPYGYDASKVTVKVETDCSEAVRNCVLYAGINVGSFSTASEVSVLRSTGAFDILEDDIYCKSSDYLLRGDILVTRTKGHTVVVLTNGAKASASGNNSGSTTPATGSVAAATLAVGTIVNFTGNLHYTSSNAASGKACKPGKAKITRTYNGKHPYHLEAVSGGGSTVHGWVDAADIQEAAAGSSGQSSGTSSGEIKVGDTVNYSGSVHYTSSYASGKSRACKGGKAKVTQISKGKPHPYHLESAEKGCTVHGWVDADKVSR